MANKSPAFQFYPNDWLSSPRVAIMTPAQRGAYIHLLCYMWMNADCGLKDDDRLLAQLTGLGPDWGESAEIVRSCFCEHPYAEGMITNQRLLDEKEKQEKFRKKAASNGEKGADKRWKRKGGGEKKEGAPKKDSQKDGADGEEKKGKSTGSNRRKEREAERKKERLEEGMKFAKEFEKLLGRTGDDREIRDTDLEAWAETYEMMIRIDKRTKEGIWRVCKWARNDEFWRHQFRSPTKLRKRNKEDVLYYDVFAEQMKLPIHRGGSVAPDGDQSSSDPAGWRDALQKILDELPQMKEDTRVKCQEARTYKEIPDHIRNLVYEELAQKC